MADLRTRLTRFWEELRGTPPVVPPVVVNMQVPDNDAADQLSPDDDLALPLVADVQPVTGIVMVISYLDTKGQPSTRQIVCRRIEQFADKAYLIARCELRQQSRTFNISRIASAIDSATGQIYEPGSKLLEAFTVDRQSTGRFRFGLSPKAFARFNAALNILAFVARCDGKWHVLETEAIENFVMACWLRLDFPGDLDLAAVTAHVARLAPDDEALWRSVYEVANHPAMARLVVQHLGRVIDADGVHHPREVYWASQIAEALQDS